MKLYRGITHFLSYEDVNTGMKFWALQEAGNFLTNRVIVSFKLITDESLSSN